MTIPELLLATLCAYRLTQLLVWDTISEPVTDWLSERSHWLDELLSCPHCVGFWCSVLSVGLLWGSRYWWPLIIPVWVFAVAGVVSIVEHATGWLACLKLVKGQPMTDEEFARVLAVLERMEKVEEGSDG